MINYTGSAKKNKWMVNTTGNVMGVDDINAIIDAELASKYKQRAEAQKNALYKQKIGNDASYQTESLRLQGLRDTSESDYKKEMLRLTGERDANDVKYKTEATRLDALRTQGVLDELEWKKQMSQLESDWKKDEAENTRMMNMIQGGVGLFTAGVSAFGKESPTYNPDGSFKGNESALGRWAGKGYDAVKSGASAVSDYLFKPDYSAYTNISEADLDSYDRDYYNDSNEYGVKPGDDYWENGI